VAGPLAPAAEVVAGEEEVAEEVAVAEHARPIPSA
jgi:hypothetical protein